MKYLILSAAAAALVACGASAQTAHPGSRNPAIKDNGVGHVRAPADGRNSFTEGQARNRILKAGYAGVSKLAKDRNGIWRGTATRHGSGSTLASTTRVTSPRVEAIFQERAYDEDHYSAIR